MLESFVPNESSFMVAILLMTMPAFEPATRQEEQ
jgi:hypothetical protein